MSSTKSLISVGMPVYNGEPYLEQAIKCVLDQTYENFELIISDNASTDSTEEICRHFAKADKRIVYIRNKVNIGAARNYNQVFSHSKGQFFRWHNADDLCDPQIHELCLSVLMKKPDTILSYGKTQLIDQQGLNISSYEDNLNLQQDKASERFKAFFRQVGLTNVIYGLMRRSAVEKTQLMGNGTYYASDTNFMAELTLYGKFYELPQTLFFRRMHEKSSSWDRRNDTIQQQFWNGKDNAFVLAHWKKFIALLKAIRNAAMNRSEKFELYGFILRNMVQQRDQLMSDLFNEVKRIELVHKV
jgi:glycosyltransferase involved in cell wall biosynthesis